MQKIIALTLSLLLLAGCTPAAGSAYPNAGTVPAYANPPAASGIEGQVLIGPTCPVVKEGVDCADRPYQAGLTVNSPEGIKIVQIQTDEQGKFRIPLPAGDYILHPESTGRYPSVADQNITVTAGQFTQIIVTYDSGIR